MDQLTSVHDALDSAVEEVKKPNLETISFRADGCEVTMAKQVCERHGVSLGGFLRHCIKGLIDDYCPPKAK